MSEEKKEVKENASKSEQKKEPEPEEASKTKNGQVEEEPKKEERKNEEDDSESEEELPPGLLEKPIEILKEKRERKKVTRFAPDDNQAPAADKKKLEIKEGSGIKLSEHPRVEWHLQRNKAEDLKIIHKLFFGVFGDLHSCKKNMRNFSGFTFAKDSPEYEKKEDYIGRFTLDNLKWALTVCDVEKKKGVKDDLIDSLLEWCLCPKPSGKSLPQKKAKKNLKNLKRKKKASANKPKSTAKVNNAQELSDLSSDSEDEKPKAKVAKVKSPKKKSAPSNPSKKQTTKKKSAQGGGSPKKISKIKIKSTKKLESSDDSDDSDAPLQKKKSPPTNGQIYASVEKILKGANLEEITMKNVCMKVYGLYPEFDLSDRKPFIKESVKKIIS